MCVKYVIIMVELGGFMSEEINETVIEQENVQENAVDINLVAKRFNWGAFFFTWIWGIGNKVWITLWIIPIWALLNLFLVVIQNLGLFSSVVLMLLSIFANLLMLAVQIWFGMKGNLWAWNKKKYKSVEHFHKIQRIWASIAIILLASHFIIVGCSTLPVFNDDNVANLRDKTMTKKHAITVQQATTMLEALNNKCDLTSEGLANCYMEQLNINAIYENKLKLADGAGYEFVADGFCKTENACYVLIDINDNRKTIVKIPLYAKDNGFLEVHQEDIDKYFE